MSCFLMSIETDVDVEAWTLQQIEVINNTYLEPEMIFLKKGETLYPTLVYCTPLYSNEACKKQKEGKVQVTFHAPNPSFASWYMSCVQNLVPTEFRESWCEATIKHNGYVDLKDIEYKRVRSLCSSYDSISGEYIYFYFKQPLINCSSRSCNVTVRYEPDSNFEGDARFSAEIDTFDEDNKKNSIEEWEYEYNPVNSTNIDFRIKKGVTKVVVKDVDCS